MECLSDCLTYLMIERNEDFIVGLGVEVERILIVTELHNHLHTFFLLRNQVVLSSLSWLNVRQRLELDLLQHRNTTLTIFSIKFNK